MSRHSSPSYSAAQATVPALAPLMSLAGKREELRQQKSKQGFLSTFLGGNKVGTPSSNMEGVAGKGTPMSAFGQMLQKRLKKPEAASE